MNDHVLDETRAAPTGRGRPTRAERRAARLDDPRFERWRTPRARRRLVVALVVLLGVETAVVAAFALVPSPAWSLGLAASLVVLLAAFVLLLGTLKASTRGVEELPAEVLDEREVQVRGEVFAVAYRTGAVLLTAVLVGVGVVTTVGWAVPGGLTLAVALVTFHVTLVLPTLVAAWRAD